MSLEKEVVVDCTKCHFEGKMLMYESINVSLDPKCKQKILDNSLFEWKCPQCGEEYTILYGFLYHDMEKKIMISFDPRETPEELTQKVEMPSLPQEFHMDGYQYRIVHGLNNLKEKLFILDAGLDDRVIEAFKMAMLPHIQEKKKDVENIAFYGMNEEKLLFVQFLKDGSVSEDAAVFPKELYDNMETNIRPLGMLEDINEFITINRQWVIDKTWDKE